MSESTGNRQSKRQYWQQVVSDWEQSDIKTQKEFCRQLGISTKSLSRWRRVFGSDQQPPQQAVGFAQIDQHRRKVICKDLPEPHFLLPP